MQLRVVPTARGRRAEHDVGNVERHFNVDWGFIYDR